MSILLIPFFIAFTVSLVLCPAVRRIGMRLGATDAPGSRKLHLETAVRIGGLGIFLSFLAAITATALFWPDIRSPLTEDGALLFFLAGAFTCFVTGFVDDVWGLGPWPKLALQVIAALSAYAGGIVIGAFIALPFDIDISANPWINLPLTVFWFLLLVNAVNLADGLDGLASGITLFACVVMGVFLTATGQLPLAGLFILLAGSIAGFLPFNFRENGGKLFLGDSGSYFLGYCIAAFSIMGSVKGQVGAALLIPLLAMSLPVFEAVFSPIRRVVLGRNPMEADCGHIHHHLLKIGFSSRKALLLLYCLTLAIGIYSLALMHVKSERFGLFVLLLGIGVLIFAFLKVMGYFSYIDGEKFRSWLGDFSFVTGVAPRRRRFLNLQVAVTGSPDMQAMWENICRALEEMDMDFAEIRIGTGDGKSAGKAIAGSTGETGGIRQAWSRNGFRTTEPGAGAHQAGKNADGCRPLLRLRLPLLAGERELGEILLIKDLSRAPVTPHTLTMIEHLRRAIERNPALRAPGGNDPSSR